MSGKIYKHNPAIRGHFVIKDTDTSTLPSEAGMDMLNYFYYKMQQNLWNIENTYELDQEHFIHHYRFSDVRRDMGLTQKHFKEDILNAIESIYQADIILKNFRTPDDTVHGYYRSRIITSYSENVDGDNDRFSISIHPMFTVMTMRNKENFTLIDNKEVRMINSKYAKRLHEYLKSKKQHTKQFNMNLEESNKILGRSDKDMRKVVDIVKRSYEVLIQFTPFEYEYDRIKKAISFSF